MLDGHINMFLFCLFFRKEQLLYMANSSQLRVRFGLLALCNVLQ